MKWHRTFILLLIIFFLGGCNSFLTGMRNPHYEAGLDLINDQQYSKAIAELQKISPKDPDYDRAQNAIALAKTRLRMLYFAEGKRLYEEENYAAAKELLRKAEPQDSFYAEARRMIISIQANDLFDEGMKYFNDGDYVKAGNTFRQALNQGATRDAKGYIAKSSEGLINKGIELYRQGALRQAINEWKKVFTFDAGNSTAKEFIKKATLELQQLENLKKGK